MGVGAGWRGGRCHDGANGSMMIEVVVCPSFLYDLGVRLICL